MDAKRILKYLRQLAKNNNRTWFLEHKPEYDAIRTDFEQGVEQAIRRIVTFDPSIIRLTVKDCTYRFYRDTRFSNDKSPCILNLVTAWWLVVTTGCPRTS